MKQSLQSIFRVRKKILQLVWCKFRILATCLLFVAMASNSVQAEPFAYVANFSSASLSVIDTATNRVTDTIPVASSPDEIDIRPDGRRAYIVHKGATPSLPGSISILETANNIVLSTHAIGADPIGHAIAPDGKRFYVTNANHDNISILDTVTETLLLPVSLPAGSGPAGVSLAPDNSRIYVTYRNTDAVAVIDTAAGVVIATIGVGATPG